MLNVRVLVNKWRCLQPSGLQISFPKYKLLRKVYFYSMLNPEISVVATDILKQATRKPHQETEAALVPLLKGIKTVADYAAVLKIFYGFYHPLEQLIERQITGELLPDMGRRRKSGWILRDLEALDLPVTPPACTALPCIQNHLQAFGALYVLEGSTLGGAIIAKMLQANPHVCIPEAALTFFRAYGDATPQLWNDFRKQLNAVVRDEAGQDQVVTAANDTFITLKQYILNHP
jgi:heme oxygenase (biliverdin-IX-beta and delta-forming)